MKEPPVYEHRYRLLWTLERRPAGVTRDEAPEGHGLCDAVLFCSIIFPEDGSYSLHFFPVDGRSEQEALSDKEMFKVWALLSKRLSESKTLDEGRRFFAQMVFEQWCEMLGMGRRGGP